MNKYKLTNSILHKDSDNLIAFVMLGLYLVFTGIWHFNTNAPWDDDCIGRYYNTKAAIGDPKQFISLWNRPLFTLLFFIPFQFSKHAVLLMSVISAGGAYALFLSAKKLKISNAFLA